MMKLMLLVIAFCVMLNSVCEAKGLPFLVEIIKIELNIPKAGEQELWILDEKGSLKRRFKFIFESNPNRYVSTDTDRCFFYANGPKFIFKSEGMLHDNIDSQVDVTNFMKCGQEYIWYFKDKEFAYAIPVSWKSAFENPERVSSHLTREADKVYVKIHPKPSTFDFFAQKGRSVDCNLWILTHAAKCNDVDAQRLLGVWNARKSRNDKNNNFKAEAKKWLDEVKKKCPKDANWINAMLSDNYDKWYAADVEFDLLYSGNSK